MVIYRVEYRSEMDGSNGYGYHTSKRGAEAGLRDGIANGWELSAIQETLGVPISKDGIMDILARWAAHPDNG